MSAHADGSAQWVEWLRSPLNGETLRMRGPNLLSDGVTLWPLIAGIPYLRIGREDLRDAAVSAILRDDVAGALALLLADRKNDSIPVANPDSVRPATNPGVTAGQAMDLLGYGDLAPYFLHRWSLPTYLSGIALLETHAEREATFLEIGCGVGQFLHAWWSGTGRTTVGSDLVFSHLWFVRQYTCPRARLICFDANGPFPLADDSVDFVFSQDSFHYFQRKEHVLSEMRRISSREMTLLGHVHNAEQPNHSPGAPLRLCEYADLIKPDLVYNDAALTTAALTGIAPHAATHELLGAASALAFVKGAGPRSSPAPQLAHPPAGSTLRVNPLIGAEGVVWPNAKFEDEFVNGWRYLSELGHADVEEVVRMDEKSERLRGLARGRVLLHLPDRWI